MNTKEEFNRKEWIEYLRVLRNEETKKLSLSGFSLSIYIIFVLTTCITLLNELPKIFHQEKNLFITILFFTSLFNFSIIISKFTHFNLSKRIENRTYSQLDKQSLLYGHIIDFCTVLLGFIGTVYILLKRPILHELWGFTFTFFCIFYLSGMVSNLAHLYNQYYKNNFPPIKITITQKIFYARFVIQVIILFISSIPIFQIFKLNLILTYFDFFKYALYIIANLFALNIIARYIHRIVLCRWLEDLESEVFIKNHDKEYIKAKLENEFFTRIRVEYIVLNKSKSDKT